MRVDEGGEDVGRDAIAVAVPYEGEVLSGCRCGAHNGEGRRREDVWEARRLGRAARRWLKGGGRRAGSGGRRDERRPEGGGEPFGASRNFF